MSKLPFISSDIPKDLRTFTDRVREAFNGTGANKIVTVGDLVRSGIAGTTPGGSLTSTPPGEIVYGTPPAPTNLQASGALANIILTWDAPGYPGHAYTEIYVAATDTFADAVKLGQAPGNTYADNVGAAATRYYWIRFVNVKDEAGPYNSTTGVSGTTGQDPDYLIGVLSDEYGGTSQAPFFQIDEPTVINGVEIPAGTYIKQAFIADATISRAKIQDLAVDNAKIADLAANKLTAGSIAVGEYIQSANYSAGSSGWRISGNGTGEFQNVIARGTIYGTDGTIGGINLTSNSVYGGTRSSYNSGTGFYLGSSGSFGVGNSTNYMTWNGSSLNVVGDITGSTGTFTGSLQIGSSPSISGTSMTGSGGVINSNGSFAFGDSGQNVTFTSGVLYLNGEVVATQNVVDNAITQATAVYNSGTISVTTSSGPYYLLVASITVSCTAGVPNHVTFSSHMWTNRKEEVFAAVAYNSSTSNIIWQVGPGPTTANQLLPGGMVAGSVVHTPSYTGSITYGLYLCHSLSGYDLYARARTISSIQLKK